MKKALTIFLIFVVIMAALLGLNSLVERLRPEETDETASGEMMPNQVTITNSMDVSDATVIRLSDYGTTFNGLGVSVKEKTVEIAYPGTYWIEGSMEDGQIVVDLGNFNGAAYLILNGISLSCQDGPAIHVKQADLTAIYLMDDTESFLSDGADYMVQEVQEKKTGACIYAADPLLFYGGGALTVYGNTADGIRSKDAVIIAAGDITVYAADDGVQGCDLVDFYGGNTTIYCYGDGIHTTEGSVSFFSSFDGAVIINSAQDGIDATGNVNIYAGSVSALTYGGPDNYETVAMNEISAKGIKGDNINIYGGTIELSTADDGLHSARNTTITGGSFDIAAGDDAVSAAGTLNIRNAALKITDSYEALEGNAIMISGATIHAVAENNGLDASLGGVTLFGTSLNITAPRAISSESVMNMLDVSLLLTADGTDSLFAFENARLIGCSILASTPAGRSDVLLAKGVVPGSVLFGFSKAVPAGTVFTVTDPSGAQVYTFSFDRDVTEVLMTMGGLLEGQSYTLTAGENAMDFTYTASGCVLNEQAVSGSAASGGWGGRR